MPRNLSVVCVISMILLVNFVATVDAGPVEDHSVADWLDIARQETKQQKQWESTHPLDSALNLGAGQYVVKLYGAAPTATLVVGPPEFIAWWKNTGAAGLEQWAKDGFPPIVDRDHLIYNTMALYSTQNTPRTNPTLYVNGKEFANPARFWAYYDRLKKSGTEVYIRGCSGEKLTREDYNTLRLFAPIVYSMWGAPYLPYGVGPWGRGLTSGTTDTYPTPGMEAPDFTLPRLESILKSPDYTDAYTFDYRRPFHSDIAAFLLYVCNGYEAIPKQQRTEGGPSIVAKPYECKFRDCVTLSSSRGKKPVLLVFNDPIDGYWASTIPLMEPLYQATRDKIDWYFICDDIGDNIYWNNYYFPPNVGGQTFQKAISMEERAQIAKNSLCMNFSNLSFPVLLDDMAQHTQNAYTDQGGIAKVILIDKKGIIALNSRLMPEPRNYTEQGEFGYRKLAQVHSLVSANVKALLDNDGVWTGKPAVMPDWQLPSTLENVKITNIDAAAGTITVAGTDGKDFSVAVDKGTRIVAAAAPDVCITLKELTAGVPISFTYETSPAPAGHTARFILALNGQTLNWYMTNPGGNAYELWCPAIVTTINDSVLTAVLAPRAKSEMRGVKFWEQPGAVAPTWEAQVVKDWVAHPDQKLTFHVDRATEVIVNGMKAKLSDIRVGDRLGVEIRPDQKPDDHRPFFIFVYRYGNENDIKPVK